MQYFWLIQALTYWSLVLAIVPYKKVKELLFFSFLGGFIYTWMAQYFGVNIFKFWSYKQTFFTIYNIPLFFVLSWFATTLLYGYFLINYPKYQIYILALFVLWTTIANYPPEKLNILYLTNWNLFLTFMHAIISHIALLYLLKWTNNVKALGAHMDIFNLKKK